MRVTKEERAKGRIRRCGGGRQGEEDVVTSLRVSAFHGDLSHCFCTRSCKLRVTVVSRIPGSRGDDLLNRIQPSTGSARECRWMRASVGLCQGLSSRYASAHHPTALLSLLAFPGQLTPMACKKIRTSQSRNSPLCRLQVSRRPPPLCR